MNPRATHATTAQNVPPIVQTPRHEVEVQNHGPRYRLTDSETGRILASKSNKAAESPPPPPSSDDADMALEAFFIPVAGEIEQTHCDEAQASGSSSEACLCPSAPQEEGGAKEEDLTRTCPIGWHVSGETVGLGMGEGGVMYALPLALLGLGGVAATFSKSASSAQVINTTSVQMALTSEVNHVANLDVQSDLVLKFENAIQLSSNADLKIHIVHDGGAGFHADSTWTQQVSMRERDFHISIADADQIRLSADGKSLVIAPKGDFDFGSNYHVEIDAGAFADRADPLKISAAVGAGAIAFATVTPGVGVSIDQAQQSQKMLGDGTLVASYSYFDIEGLGNFADILSTPLNLSGRGVALVYKDYDNGPVQNDADIQYSGIGVGAHPFNLQVQNFGADDLIYFDDQRIAGINALSANSTAQLQLAHGLMLNSLDSQTTVGDLLPPVFVGTLQIDPALHPTDASQSGPEANNGAGFLGIQSLEALTEFNIPQMVISG